MFVVPIEAGIKYMQNPLPMAVLDNYGKDDRSPFGCQSIEDQTGKYEEHRCGGSQSCQFQVDIDSDNIHETRCVTQSLGSPLTEVFRYMKICKNSPDGRQQCPDQDRYPWLTDTCGGNDPCADCVL